VSLNDVTTLIDHKERVGQVGHTSLSLAEIPAGRCLIASRLEQIPATSTTGTRTGFSGRESVVLALGFY